MNNISFFYISFDECNGKIYRNKLKQFHRVDGPAIEYPSGNKYWYLNGKLHKKNGPAFEDGDGSKQWYFNGQIHRLDGLATENSNGEKSWWVNYRNINSIQNSLALLDA